MTTTTRDRILDALEELLLERGMPQVTLESVAAAAGMSKGGLLYHYESKDTLLAGLMRRLGDRSHEQLRVVVEQGKSVAEQYLQAPSPDNDADTLQLALSRSTVAAMRTVDAPHNERGGELHRALHEVMDAWGAGLDTEIDDPVRADIIRLVGDGVFLRALLGAPPIDPDRYQAVVTRLLHT